MNQFHIEYNLNYKTQLFAMNNTRVIFYVRRIGLYLYKYRIYGTLSIYISPPRQRW